MNASQDSTMIGIDLGTTHCCVAYINKNGMVDVIANKGGHKTTPSYIVLTQKGILVGKIAKEEYFKPPENVVYDSKRLIGRNFDDKYIQNDLKNWTFKVKNCKNKPIIELSFEGEPVDYKPQEISAMLLDHIKRAAEEYIGEPVSNAVITVPAHFNHHQRTTTAEAGKLAGLNVVGIINEPTAAALAYIHKNNLTDSKNILVFDLGGGTFDVSIVKVEANTITVAATAGNTHLGGRDFDNNLSDFIFKRIEEEFGKDALKSNITKRRIRSASENLKIRLSLVEEAVFDLPYLHNGEDVQIEISRAEFEEINFDLFKLTIEVVQYCLDDAKLKKTEIDDIVLVGGSVRIPKIQQMLGDFFDGRTLNKTINPDEAVAYGAAVQTAKFKNSDKDEAPVKIIDVTPLSLGIECNRGLMNVIIPRNSTIPISATVSYCSVIDKQTIWTWKIYQGERALTKDNIYLGRCRLKLPPKPPGYSMEFTLQVNEEGSLQVSVHDKSGFHKTLSIEYQECDPQTVNDIIRDAEINKSCDEKKELVIENWGFLRDYCTRLQAICDYDKKNMNSEDKHEIKSTTTEILNWTENNLVSEGSKEEGTAIDEKFKQIEAICAPIVKRYGYKIRYLSWSAFYKLITKEN